MMDIFQQADRCARRVRACSIGKTLTLPHRDVGAKYNLRLTPLWSSSDEALNNSLRGMRSMATLEPRERCAEVCVCEVIPALTCKLIRIAGLIDYTLVVCPTARLQCTSTTATTGKWEGVSSLMQGPTSLYHSRLALPNTIRCYTPKSSDISIQSMQLSGALMQATNEVRTTRQLL